MTDGSKIDSYEYWVGHESEKGLGFRAGRFLPAYGIRFADHTALNRAPLGLDKYDQVLGLEMSYATERHLLQVSVGPGRADSVYHDDGRGAFTATGRFQWDLGPRTVLVASGLFRDTATLVPRTGAGGVAFGYAPTPRLSTWTELDAQFEQGAGGTPRLHRRQRDGLRGLSRGVAQVLAPASYGRRRHLGGHPEAGLLPEPLAENPLERDRFVLPRPQPSNERHHEDVPGPAPPVPLNLWPRPHLTGAALSLWKRWLGGRDSNPDSMVQSHVSYRWTTSQQGGLEE